MDDETPLTIITAYHGAEHPSWDARNTVTFSPHCTFTLEVFGKVCRYINGAWYPIRTHGDS